MARIGGAPASFALDMAAARFAPVATHPLRVQIRVKLLRPRPDGLRDGSELEAMGIVEDTLVPRMESSLDAIYVGRFVAEGSTTFVFYAPEAASPKTKGMPGLIGDLGAYTAEWLSENDPEWGAYREFLFPDPMTQERMMNAAQLRQRTEIGDSLDVPREIDHFARFASQANAEAAAKALRAAGFRVDEVAAPRPAEGDDPGDDLWSLHFHRNERLDGHRPDAFCAEIRGILAPHHGDYDGWGGPVVKP